MASRVISETVTPRRAASWRRRASRSSGSFTVVRFMYASIPPSSESARGGLKPKHHPLLGCRPGHRQFDDPARPGVAEHPAGSQHRHPAHPAGGIEGDHPQRLLHPPAVDRACGQQEPAPLRSGAQAAPPLPAGARPQQRAGATTPGPPPPRRLHGAAGLVPSCPHGQGKAPQAGFPQEQGQPRASSQRRSRLADRPDAPFRPPHPHRRGLRRAREALPPRGPPQRPPRIRKRSSSTPEAAEEAAAVSLGGSRLALRQLQPGLQEGPHGHRRGDQQPQDGPRGTRCRPR